MSKSRKTFDALHSVRNYQVMAIAALLVLFGAIGTWAAGAAIRGAVIASGFVIVETNSKKVQHRDGGIVEKINVKQGDLVNIGSVIAVMDDTETRAEMAIVQAVLEEMLAQKARLDAEVLGLSEIEIPEELATRSGEPRVQVILSGQQKLFASRRASNKGKKEQLSQRILQLRDEIRGLEAQLDSRRQQLDLIKQELEGMEQLERKKLVRATRVLALKRESARLTGEVGELIAQIARAKGSIGETELQILQIEEEYMSNTLAEQRDTQTRISELKERRIAANAKLQRTEVVAPQTGFVHELAIHTVGGVVSPGETLMLIVPESDRLIIEAMVRPEDITQVHVGQNALVRLPSYEMRQVAQVTGTVAFVAADLTVPDAPEKPFYKVRVEMQASEVDKLGGEPLKPGMPVEVFVQTDERSPLSFLVKPLSDQIAHAFRER